MTTTNNNYNNCNNYKTTTNLMKQNSQAHQQQSEVYRKQKCYKQNGYRSGKERSDDIITKKITIILIRYTD